MEVRRGADGILRGRSDFLRLDLCVRPDGQIRLYDHAGGEWLSSHEEAVSERDDAERRADENARERDIAARRAAAAERERDDARAEAERLRARLRALGIQK